MQKIYFKMLAASIIVFFGINVVSYLVDFNKLQLTNPSFFNERITALYYLGKNILVETGVNLKKTDADDISKYISQASEMYVVDKSLLETLVSYNSEYSMTLTGGMGLTSISTKDFLRSSFQNPYNAEENIMAAAETISAMQDEGLTNEEIIMKFLLGNNEENIEFFAKSEYDRAIELTNAYRTTVANVDNNNQNYVR